MIETMFGIDLGDASNLFTVGVVYGGMVVAAFWLAMIIWTFRDMRARSRDRMAQVLVAIMVAVLTLPGLLIYIFLRPRETLSEAYERSLEEEALLQEIEEKPTCPGCGQRVHDEWQICPHCHTRLKRPCHNCGDMLELSWRLCPHCAASQVDYDAVEIPTTNYNPAQPHVSLTRQDSAGYANNTYNAQTAESLEFIDGDDYQ